MYKFILLYLTLVGFCSTIPIDNGVEGEPEVECGPTSITVNFNTEKPFQGHVYVKGLYDEEGCRNDEVGRMVAGITLPFDTCNVARTRSLNPRGIYVTTTVVISFHPLFVTKVDKAYRIQCFYQEADRTVSAQLEVSELTTSLDSLITQVVPLPICRYEILNGGPTGQPLDFAEIGQEVYHKWTCESETIDTFCMVVHSCYVDDGNGDTVQVLNSEGCALDKFLIDNLEYTTDLTAGQKTTVFKFADKTQLYYQCQITITVKEPHSECPRPQCSEPAAFGAVKSKDTQQKPYAQLRLLKRSAEAENTLDVRTELSTMDINERKMPSELLFRRLQRDYAADRSVFSINKYSNEICMSNFGILCIIALLVTCITATIVVFAVKNRFHLKP